MMPKEIKGMQIEQHCTEGGDGFVWAERWCDTYWAGIESARQHWRALCLYGLLPLLGLLLGVLAWLCLTPRLVPMLIHHYPNGQVFVTPVLPVHVPVRRAQMESELVRYVINRESYHPETYRQQYRLIHLLSDGATSRQYRRDQTVHNPNALVNRLGRAGRRHVEIDSIIFLNMREIGSVGQHSRGKQPYVAEIHFVLRDTDNHGRLLGRRALTALVAWRYRAMPRDPEQRWRNWDGFTVVRYQLQQWHVETKKNNRLDIGGERDA